jgi:caffeoyl-CoA O-methyltransferase
MTAITTPEIEAYAEEHTTPPSGALRAVEAETRATFEAHGMMVGTIEGRFLEMLVHATRARRVLEIGTFTGYSSIAMAAALPPEGRIVTCDVSEEHIAVARRHIESSGNAGRISIEPGPALGTIERLEGPFDLVFIDADKESYLAYFEATLPKLAPHGLIVADNTLWHGAVLDAAAADADTVAIRRFNAAVARDPRVSAVLLPIRDGVTLIRPVPPDTPKDF